MGYLKDRACRKKDAQIILNDPREGRDTYEAAREKWLHARMNLGAKVEEIDTTSANESLSNASGYAYAQPMNVNGITIARDPVSCCWFPLAPDGYDYVPVKGNTLAETGWDLKKENSELTPSEEKSLVTSSAVFAKSFVSWSEVSEASLKVPIVRYCLESSH